MALILIIEDNASNRDLMTFLLGKFGHTCIVAKDGLEGLEVTRQKNPDIILCDIQLPNLDGYGVVRSLKSNQAFMHTPVLAVSSYAMTGDKEKALAAGFDGYISKPIEPTTFVSEVETVLSASKRADQ